LLTVRQTAVVPSPIPLLRIPQKVRTGNVVMDANLRAALTQEKLLSSPEMPGFIELGISPHSVEAILQKMLSNCG